MFTFVESRLFTRRVGSYLSDDAYRELQLKLAVDPELKQLLRTSSEGSRGKSMDRTKRDVGREVLEGILELKQGKTGRVSHLPSVTQIREGTGLSQARFAQLLGVSVRTLQEWEQGRRSPSGAARTLLLIAAQNPRALLEVA